MAQLPQTPVLEHRRLAIGEVAGHLGRGKGRGLLRHHLFDLGTHYPRTGLNSKLTQFLPTGAPQLFEVLPHRGNEEVVVVDDDVYPPLPYPDSLDQLIEVTRGQPQHLLERCQYLVKFQRTLPNLGSGVEGAYDDMLEHFLVKQVGLELDDLLEDQKA